MTIHWKIKLEHSRQKEDKAEIIYIFVDYYFILAWIMDNAFLSAIQVTVNLSIYCPFLNDLKYC